MSGDRRDADQGRRDITGAIGVALLLVALALCCGMWLWWTTPAG